jgi:SAM-dependent methyltransferase
MAVILALGGVALLGTVAVSYLVYRSANVFRSDPTPLPRPRINAPYIQSPHPIVNLMVETAQIRQEDLVYDLGCGDGRLVIQAAKKYGCRGVGFDNDPQRVSEARTQAVEQGVEDLVRIEIADVFTVDLSEADVVLMYLLPWMIKELIPQFEDLKPGSRIVSHDFPIEGMQADKKVEIAVENERSQHIAYLYITPLRKQE